MKDQVKTPLTTLQTSHIAALCKRCGAGVISEPVRGQRCGVDDQVKTPLTTSQTSHIAALCKRCGAGVIRESVRGQRCGVVVIRESVRGPTIVGVTVFDARFSVSWFAIGPGQLGSFFGRLFHLLFWLTVDSEFTSTE